MKITFVSHDLGMGGAEKTVVYLANNFANKGHQIDILIYGDRGKYVIDDKVKITKISESNKGKSGIQRVLNAIKRKIVLHKLLKQINPDLIFCMLFPSFLYLWGEKFPVITSERSNPAFLKNKKKIFIRKLIYKFSDGIVFQTKRAREYYPFVKDEKCVVIPNAVWNDSFDKIDRQSEIEKNVVTMGTLKPEKDFKTLISAFKVVHEKHSNYTLQIYGDGRLRAELQSFSRELGIEDSVKFMGSRKDALYCMQNATCYVMSSISEGMPNALMEAMAIGLPCVSTNCPNGPAELIEDNISGILVPVKDSEAMASAICRFIEDEEFAKSCGKNASKIKETNTVDKISKKYLDYIMLVIRRKNEGKVNLKKNKKILQDSNT